MISNVEKGHTWDEYEDLFGDYYDAGELAEHTEDEFIEGFAKYRWDIVYWLINGLYYETTLPFDVEALEESRKKKKKEHIHFVGKQGVGPIFGNTVQAGLSNPIPSGAPTAGTAMAEELDEDKKHLDRKLINKKR